MSNTRTIVTRAALGIGGVLLLTTSLYAQDRCSDILKDGVKAQVTFTGAKTVDEDTADWFCSNSFESFIENKDAGFKLAVPIKGVPVEFSGQKKSGTEWQKRDQFCKSSKRTFNSDETFSLWRSVADTAIVEGWLKCMVPQSESSPLDKPVFVSLAAKGDVVTIESRWIKQDTHQHNPIITAVTMSGLTCARPKLVAKVKLIERATSQTCSWDTNKDALVVIDTTHGSASARVSAPLDGKPAGKATLRVVPLVASWVPVGQQSATTTTGNHHQCCYGDAGPRHFGYSVRLDVPQNQKIANATVAPTGGVGCPWTGQVTPLIIENNERTARVGIEAWGHPCTWTLTANVVELRDVPQPQETINIDLAYNRPFSVSLPKKRQSAVIAFELVDGSKPTLNADGAGNEAIQVVGKELGGDRDIFTYTIPPPRRKPGTN